MPRLNYSDIIDKNMKDKPSTEHMLGYGLLAPFSPSISGARQILFANQKTHVFPLLCPEKAILETGYEIRFGDYSSSVTKADSDYTVIAKISKFSFAPNHHYWLIVKDNKRNYLDVVERISYHYITESYGYLYNNEYMDSLQVGDIIKDNTVIQKSLAFDEYNNRRDGVNFNVTYMALDDTLEDAIILSDKASSKIFPNFCLFVDKFEKSRSNIIEILYNLSKILNQSLSDDVIYNSSFGLRLWISISISKV
jgi:DNA-directed RNA polymerase beta subunit